MTLYFTHEGRKLAYDARGDAAAAPVVFLHGLSDARETWTRICDALPARYRIYTLDARGHGESGRAPGAYRIEGYGADVIAFCREVVGRPAVLVGHSLGGFTAAYVAAGEPALVAGALLEDPPLYLGTKESFDGSAFAALFPVMQQAIRAAQASDDPQGTLSKVLAGAPSLRGEGTMAEDMGPEAVALQAQVWAKLDAEAFTPAIAGEVFASYDPDTPLAPPVRVLRADPALGPAFFPEHEARLRASTPHATFALAEGASHLIHAEAPDWFRAELEAFLDQHAR